MLFLISRGGADMFTKLKTKLSNKIKQIKNLISKTDKWKLYLYLDGQCIGKQIVDTNFKPMENIYILKVKHFKHLIGTNRPTLMVFNYHKYKWTDNDKKTVHIEVKVNGGSDITV